MLTIFLDYPPSTNRIWRQSKGRMYQPKEVVNYKMIAAWKARQQGAKPTDGNIEIEATLHPKTTKKGIASKTRIDLDNVCKIVLDSFNGVCYNDDKQITKIVLEVGEAIKDGGITITITERGATQNVRN